MYWLEVSEISYNDTWYLLQNLLASHELLQFCVTTDQLKQFQYYISSRLTSLSPNLHRVQVCMAFCRHAAKGTFQNSCFLLNQKDCFSSNISYNFNDVIILQWSRDDHYSDLLVEPDPRSARSSGQFSSVLLDLIVSVPFLDVVYSHSIGWNNWGVTGEG